MVAFPISVLSNAKADLTNPKINKNVKIDFPKIEPKKIKEILLKYEFSEKRIDNQLEKLGKLKKEREQRTLF